MQDGELSINGRKYVYGRYQTATPVPYVFQVPLLVGYCALEVVYRVIGRTPWRNGSPVLLLEWVTPSGRREPIPEAALYHEP